MHKFLTKKIAAKERVSFTAEFSDLSPEQAASFKRLFAWMNVLGGWGSSREFKIFYDGDGAARCTIKVDGKELRPEADDQAENDKTDFEQLKFSFD